MACKCCYPLLQLLRTQVCTLRLSIPYRPLRQLKSLQAVPRHPSMHPREDGVAHPSCMGRSLDCKGPSSVAPWTEMHCHHVNLVDGPCKATKQRR